jgi:hypothetical protein
LPRFSPARGHHPPREEGPAAWRGPGAGPQSLKATAEARTQLPLAPVTAAAAPALSVLPPEARANSRPARTHCRPRRLATQELRVPPATAGVLCPGPASSTSPPNQPLTNPARTRCRPQHVSALGLRVSPAFAPAPRVSPGRRQDFPRHLQHPAARGVVGVSRGDATALARAGVLCPVIGQGVAPPSAQRPAAAGPFTRAAATRAKSEVPSGRSPTRPGAEGASPPQAKSGPQPIDGYSDRRPRAGSKCVRRETR